MTLLRKIGGGLRALFWRRRTEQEMDEELRGYLDAAMKEKMRNGMSREEALRAARIELGSMDAVKEEIRSAGWESTLETFWQDVRYGVRQSRRSPGLTSVVVLSLALGIGANTAIFSLIDAVMLRMLPVKDPQQLVLLSSHKTKDGRGPTYSGYGISLSYTGFERLRRQHEIFSSAIGFVPLGFSPESVTANIDGQPTLAGGEMVSGNYFSGLGVPAMLGRVLADEDEASAHRVTMLSYGYWTGQFGRNPAILGKTITLGGQPYTIVGVTPPGFFGVEPGRAPDFWVPLADEPGLTPWGVQPSQGQSPFTDKRWWWLMIIGRLQPGVSQEQARAAMDVWLQQTLTGDMGLSQSEARNFVINLEPASQGLNGLREQFSQPLRILMGVVGLVLPKLRRQTETPDSPGTAGGAVQMPRRSAPQSRISAAGRAGPQRRAPPCCTPASFCLSSSATAADRSRAIVASSPKARATAGRLMPSSAFPASCHPGSKFAHSSAGPRRPLSGQQLRWRQPTGRGKRLPSESFLGGVFAGDLLRFARVGEVFGAPWKAGVRRGEPMLAERRSERVVGGVHVVYGAFNAHRYGGAGRSAAHLPGPVLPAFASVWPQSRHWLRF